MLKLEVAKLGWFKEQKEKYDKNSLEILSNDQQGKDLAYQFMTPSWVWIGCFTS